MRPRGMQNGISLGNFRQLATQVTFNAALMPEAKRPRVVDDPKGRNRGHEQEAADDEKDARCPGLRHLQNHQRVARRKQHGGGQRQHADARKQVGHVLGPASGGMIFSKEPEPVRDQAGNDDEIGNDSDPGFCVHNTCMTHSEQRQVAKRTWILRLFCGAASSFGSVPARSKARVKNPERYFSLRSLMRKGMGWVIPCYVVDRTDSLGNSYQLALEDQELFLLLGRLAGNRLAAVIGRGHNHRMVALVWAGAAI